MFWSRLAVVGFVLWHAFAVLVYSVPRVAADPISTWTRRRLVPVVGPYMFLTSQWQLWNLFAPDPTRLVTIDRIDVGELPISFRLSNQNVMVAGTEFSGTVQVTARVDRDQEATTRKTGDIEGILRVTIPAKDVKLVLDKRLP